MAVRSSDPLTAATTSILIPRLRQQGFRRKTTRIIARIQNDIFQFFDLQLEAYGSKTFCVNYATLSLFWPRDYLVLQPGGRLNSDNGTEAWLPAKTHDEADASMVKVVNMAENQALPFFDTTKSVAGLLECLSHENWGSRHHQLLERAFCEARLGRLDDAKSHARQAIDLYREDGRAWSSEYIELCQQLIGGLEGDRLPEMFERWIDHSGGKLGLSKIRK